MATQSTILSQEGRRGGAGSDTTPSQPDYVRTVEETAKILSIGTPSLRALIYRGEGPKITRLSARRFGIRDSDREAYLARINATD